MKLKDVPVKLSRVIIICLIVSVLTGAIVYAALPTMPFTINRGIYPGGPSFTVWKEDTTYFAKNHYGVIAYSGSDAATVINNAFALAEDGSIFISEGTYTLTGLSTDGILELPDGITIEGVYGKTILILDDSELPELGAFAAYPIITNNDHTNGNSGIHLKNLVIDGNSAGQSSTTHAQTRLLETYGLSESIIENCVFQNSYGALVGFLSAGANDPTRIRFQNNIVRNCAEVPEATQSDLWGGNDFTDFWITGNDFSGSYGAGPTCDRGLRVHFTNNVVHDNGLSGTYAGLGMYGWRDSVVSNNIFYGEYQSGINVAPDPTYAYHGENVISDNVFKDTFSAIFFMGDNEYGLAYRYTIQGGTIQNTQQHGIFVQFARYCIVEGVTIEGASQESSDTYDAISFKNVTHSTVANVIIPDGFGTIRQAFTEQSATDCNYNTVINLGPYCDTFGGSKPIEIEGANTKVSSSWNGTSWIS